MEKVERRDLVEPGQVDVQRLVKMGGWVEQVDLVKIVEGVDLVKLVKMVEQVDLVDPMERVDQSGARHPMDGRTPKDKRTFKRTSYRQADLDTSGL